PSAHFGGIAAGPVIIEKSFINAIGSWASNTKKSYKPGTILSIGGSPFPWRSPWLPTVWGIASLLVGLHGMKKPVSLFRRSTSAHGATSNNAQAPGSINIATGLREP